MPWFNLNQWTDADLRAFYKYVRALGPIGDATPAFVPAETKPTPPTCWRRISSTPNIGLRSATRQQEGPTEAREAAGVGGEQGHAPARDAALEEHDVLLGHGAAPSVTRS